MVEKKITFDLCVSSMETKYEFMSYTVYSFKTNGEKK